VPWTRPETTALANCRDHPELGLRPPEQVLIEETAQIEFRRDGCARPMSADFRRVSCRWCALRGLVPAFCAQFAWI